MSRHVNCVEEKKKKWKSMKLPSWAMRKEFLIKRRQWRRDTRWASPAGTVSSTSLAIWPVSEAQLRFPWLPAERNHAIHALFGRLKHTLGHGHRGLLPSPEILRNLKFNVSFYYSLSKHSSTIKVNGNLEASAIGLVRKNAKSSLSIRATVIDLSVTMLCKWIFPPLRTMIQNW